MARIFEGRHEAAGLRIGIVVARFNETYTQRLLAGALEELKSAGIADDKVDVVWVPGAFEIPVAVQTLCDSKRYDAIAALGCVIRGETPHFDYVCRGALDGITRIALDTRIPVTNGLITADTVEQAVARSGHQHRNLGAHAARAAVEMASVLNQARKQG